MEQASSDYVWQGTLLRGSEAEGAAQDSTTTLIYLPGPGRLVVPPLSCITCPSNNPRLL